MGESEDLRDDAGVVQGARVMRYGCVGPVDGREHVEHQLRAARRYYNDLIALERCRRSVYREMRRQYFPLVDQLEQEVSALVAELEVVRARINLARQQARARTAEKTDSAEALRIGRLLRERSRALKDARKQAADDPAFLAAVSAIDGRAGVWQRGLRALTECHWGTYLTVEQSVQQARRGGADPAFRHARGTERVSRSGRGPAAGSISVQIQKGMTFAELESGRDTRLRLVPIPPRELSPSARRNPNHRALGERRSARGLRRVATHHLYVRVGSEGRKPRWAVFPVLAHRPFPEGAVIKGATVSLRVIAQRESWWVSLLYTRPIEPAPERPGVIAIDLGWRKRPDSALRVAYWVDDSGRRGEVKMPPTVRARMQKARDLQSIEDRHFDLTRDALVQFIQGATALPEWIARETSHLHAWRSTSRLRQLVHAWRDQRFPGDEDIFELAEAWLHRSRHRSQWMDDARDNALLYRREVYRRFAARCAREYGAVVVEKFDLRQAKGRSAPEGERDSPPPVRRQLHESAPGEARDAILRAAEREQALIVTIDAGGTTESCHACGGVCAWDQSAEIWHTCEHCGSMWDQDENAAKNLLRRFADKFGDRKARDAARAPKKRASRFGKRHKKRDAEAEGARAKAS